MSRQSGKSALYSGMKLTSMQTRALDLLAGDPDISMADLAAHLSTTPASAGLVVSALRSKGAFPLVEAVPPSEDVSDMPKKRRKIKQDPAVEEVLNTLLARFMTTPSSAFQRLKGETEEVHLAAVSRARSMGRRLIEEMLNG